jgi:hypothetical protein
VTLDTRTGADLKYFSTAGKMFPPDGLLVEKKSQVNVKCNWPFNTESTKLTVEVFFDDVTVDTLDLDMEARSYIEHGLLVTRDLVDPYKAQDVRSIMWSRNISPNLYVPYVLQGEQIGIVGLSDTLTLGTVLVCVHKDAQNEPEILRALENRLRILPNRHV